MSLPAPVSPQKVTVTSVLANRSSASNSSCIAAERPTTRPKCRTSPNNRGAAAAARSRPSGGVDLGLSFEFEASTVAAEKVDVCNSAGRRTYASVAFATATFAQRSGEERENRLLFLASEQDPLHNP